MVDLVCYLCYYGVMSKELVKIDEILPKTSMKMSVRPEKIEDLKEEALLTLKQALGATDKMGSPSKVAVDAAKFIYSESSIKDSDDYKKMIEQFRGIIVKQRKTSEPLGNNDKPEIEA